MKMQNVLKGVSKWEDLYSGQWRELPWISADLPLDPLREFFGLLKPPKRILDFGCGNGRVAKVLDQWGGQVTGADCSGTAIANAQPLSRGSYVKACDLGEFEKESFEGVLLWGVLHHYAPETWSFWAESAKRVLSSKGYLLVGGFDCDDVGFHDSPIRVSPTTGSNAYCLHRNLIERVMQQLNYQVIANSAIELQDGVSSNVRTWRYLIGRI